MTSDIRSVQNAWTRRQTFNPDTLVLRGPGNQTVKVNTQPVPPVGEGLEQEVLLPSPGTTIGGLASQNLTTQALTNQVATILFSTDIDVFGDAPVRNGSSFIIQRSGKYYVGVGMHVTQLNASNVIRFWLSKNGVASIPYFGTSMNTKNQGNIDDLGFQGYLNFNTGDVVTVRALCSLINGASLNSVAASGEAPAIPTAAIQFVGYLDKGT